MAYVDGFVVPVKKDRLDDYRAMATMARDIWKEAGAVDYVECLPDDVQVGEVTSFPRAVQLQDDETVVLSWIVYPSREVRDQVNSKVMSDPRFKEWENRMPFDGKRLIWGGFKPFIGLGAS
jgi:uncharacterized protein YbaA (DUF1428 family)